MFARTGVRIAWLDGKSKTANAAGGSVVIHVRFIRQPADQCTSKALGYSTPLAEGTKNITLLLDRIQLAAGWSPLEQDILAHVLAHEIGHVLQGTDQHSQTGVMKAYWDRQDYVAMEMETLRFTPADVDLIRVGLNRLKARVGYQAGDSSNL